MATTDTKTKPLQKSADLSPEDLKEENRYLRELVVDLSRIIARSVSDEKKK